MKKRIVIALIALLLTGAITYGEYEYMKSQVKEEPLEIIYCLSRTVERGDRIKLEDFVEKFIKASDVEPTFVKELSSVVGLYAENKIFKDSVAIKNQFTGLDQLKLSIDENNILVTFAFNGETANGWNIRKGQEVQLLYCPRIDESYVLYDNVIVNNIYSKQVIPTTDGSVKELMYVTFEIEKNKGYDLVSKRENGRVEIIIL